ncbi:MAG: TolC family protein [Burkholderiales bacterium]|nr:TolC family protein [Burkholderiales bacterium]
MRTPQSKPTWPAALTLAFALGAALLSPAAPAATARRATPAAPSAAPAPSSNSRCISDESADPQAAPAFRTVPSAAGGASTPGAGSAPRMNLLAMVRGAIHRSNAVGAAKLLSEAAAIDIDEAHAAYWPQVGISGQVGGIDAGAPNSPSVHGKQFQGGVNVSAPLYDGGHTRDMTDYRTHLAEVARYGEVSAQEQVALQTVSLALDRSRYTVEAQVYDQYARKMSCLVEALEMIVSADRGRTSELVQARKTQQQAELQRDQVLSQKRLTEIRLRRFVGDDLPPTEGIASVMLDTPALPDLLTMASRAAEIQSLDSQAAALDSYVRAVLDGQKPQLGLLVAATKSAGAGDSRSVSGGITFNWQLFNAASKYTTQAARKRAAAARMNREDALEARKYRMAEVHEQAEHAMDRARSVIEILHNSELVRNFTLQQWQQLGRRSLFDVMAAEGDHYNMRVQYVDALYDTQQSNALLWSLGLGLANHLE